MKSVNPNNSFTKRSSVESAGVYNVLMEKHLDMIPYAASTVINVCSNLYYKCLTSLAVVTYSFCFDPLNQKPLIAVGALIIVDFITGIVGAKLSGEEIQSGKVFRSALKATIYMIFIASAHITGIAFPFISEFTEATVISFLAITEFISIIENIGKMGFAIPTRLLNKLTKLRDEEYK